MDRLFVLHNLTACMREAAADRNWEALMRVNTLVGGMLSELASHGAWSASERAALDELRAAHLEASAYCSSELKALGERLAEMRASQSGWRAYAGSGELAEEKQA